MLMTIALLVLLLFLFILLLVFRPSPVLFTSPPLQSRHVSFTYSLPTPPSLTQRRWSSPFPKRNSSTLDYPRPPQSASIHSAPATPVDQFGRILLSSPPKPSRRISTPLRLSFASRRSASCTPTLIHVDPSPPSLVSATLPPLQRPKFVNPFARKSRSKTLSPPSTLKSLHMSSNPSGASTPSSPPSRRRTLASKFKSIFTSIPPDPNSPTIRSKPIFINLSTKLRRKPIARTQPYGPPWNAPMPVPDFDLPQHSFQKPTQTISPPGRKRSVHGRSRPETTSISPGQISPRTFVSELDEKLSLLQQQRHART